MEESSPEDASWEDAHLDKDTYLNLNLEDKVAIRAGGNDTRRRTQRVPVANPRYPD